MVKELDRGHSLRDERRRQLELVSQNHLLAAAEMVFAEKGYARATVKEIADRSEFSVGAVYQFFESKEALFRGVMQRRNLEIRQDMESVLARSDDPYTQLHAIIDFIAEWADAHESFSRLFQQAIGGSWMNLKVGFDETNWTQYEDILALEAGVFAAGIEQRVFRSLDPVGTAVVFAGMLQAYLAHRVVGVGVSGGSGGEALPLSEVHLLVDRAFVLENKQRRRASERDSQI